MNYTEIKNKTQQKFQSMEFQVGDIFSEMLSNWKVIVRVDGDKLTIISGPHSNLKIEQSTKEEFKYNCSYKNIDGYWIDFMKNDTSRVSDYIEAYIEQMKFTADEIRDFKLDLVL